jgi:pentatricopeptide repeat protein
LTDEEADRRRLGKSQHTTSRSSERHFSSSSSSNNSAASVFRRDEEIIKMMKQQQQHPHVKQQPAPPLSAPVVVVVDDPSSSKLNENATWQPKLMTNQQRQTSSSSSHYKKKTKRRWRPFFPPEVIALIKDEDVVSSSLDATTLSSSSSRQLLAELSLDELRERTKDLRQWCVYANDKGRFRAERRASAPAIQLVLDTIWRVLYEWKNRSKVVGIIAAQQAHNLYAVAHTTQPAKDQITLDHLDIVLEACANCGADGGGGEEAAVLAEKTFVRSFHPANINSYNLLLKCWANAGVGPVAAQRADRWWQDIMEEVEQHQRCYPTNETIINYMAAWTQNGGPNAPEKVDDLFRQILHERQPRQLQPQPQQPPPGNDDNNNGDSNSTKQSQPSPSRNVVLRSKVLRHIMHENQAPPPGNTNTARNNIATIQQQPQAAPLQQQRQRNIAILRNVRSQEVLPRPHRQEQQQQQQHDHNAKENKKGRPPALRILPPQSPPPRPNVIFRDLQMDDPALFHGVLRSWGTSGRGRPAAMEAERIVRNMPRYGCQPNATTYSLLIAAWTAAEHLERTGDAAVRAETILQDMVQRQLHKEKNKLRPSAATAFTTCITAWSWAATQHPDAPERAEALLRQLLQTELLHHDSSSSSGSSHGNNQNNNSGPALLEQPPSVVAAQNAVLSVWARSTHRPDAISHMQQHFVSSMKNSDLDSYNTLLDGYARRGLTSEARALFDTMKKHSNRDLHPNLASYNVLLRAYVQSPDTRMEEVETLLYEMEDAMSTVEPDKFTYTCKC